MFLQALSLLLIYTIQRHLAAQILEGTLILVPGVFRGHLQARIRGLGVWEYFVLAVLAGQAGYLIFDTVSWYLEPRY
jgi:hypothetical protein